MKVIVTGCAGFIGWKVVKKLCRLGFEVIGIDNLNDYYDVRLKEWRLKDINTEKNFSFIKANVADKEIISKIYPLGDFNAVINLASSVGIRTSFEDPYNYISTNLVGTLNLLEFCRQKGIKKFILASTSSLYAGKRTPFTEDVATLTPISPYAATKGGAEGLAYSYHYHYDIDVSVLRYFTVYGPTNRPDMAIFRFIKWAMEGKPIVINGDGTQSRDFTYVDDIAEGTIKALKKVGYEIINLGGDSPHSLNEAVSLLEKILNKKLEVKNLPFFKGDMQTTWASIAKAKTLLDWRPTVSFEEGLCRTVSWARENIELMSLIVI